MNKIYSAILVQFVYILAVPTGCGSYSEAQFPEQMFETNEQEEVTVWIEEIRQEDQVGVLGYLEKKRVMKNGASGSRYAYIVYDSEFNEIYEGMIFDTGETYVHTNNGELKRVGLMNIREGVKRILELETSVTFFRDGRQVYHQSE